MKDITHAYYYNERFLCGKVAYINHRQAAHGEQVTCNSCQKKMTKLRLNYKSFNHGDLEVAITR